jgi:hypothetical protein
MEIKFIRKSVMKMILVRKKGLLMTKPNYQEIINQIGFWVGRIAKGGREHGGFTDEEVGELLAKLDSGFIKGATE